MRFSQYLLMVLALSFSFGEATASDEIYKWKDKSGVMRYTDMPPPTGTKNVRKIKRKARANSTVSKGAGDVSSNSGDIAAKQPMSDDDIAKKEKELQKVKEANKKVMQEDEKRKKLNCAAAKANFATYNRGGRIAKTNANGEREYLGDDAIQAGKVQAQREMANNC